MQAIDPNYVPPENAELEKFPDGSYQAKGFTWFTLDDNTKKPILVAQKNNKLVARLRFKLVDGKQGPPMSVELGEVALLVRAFGGDISKLPVLPAENQPGMVSSYLEVAQALSKLNVVTIISKNGWVNANGVSGMGVPEGLYYFRLVEVAPIHKDTGIVTPKEGQFGKFFFVTFEIVAGEGGGETQFKKATFQELVSYAVTVDDSGQPDWQRTEQSKQYTSAAVRLSNLMRLTAPSLFEDEFTPPDPYNLLPWWSGIAIAENKVLGGTRVKNEKGEIRLMWSTLKSGDSVSVPPTATQAPLVQAAPIMQQQDSLAEKESENLRNADEKARAILRTVMNEMAGVETVVNNNLNDAGKEIARKYFAPLKKGGQINNGSYSKLDFDDITVILDNLLLDNIEIYKEQLIAAGVGFDTISNETEDEWGSETPF